MSEKDLSSAKPPDEIPPFDFEEQSKQQLKAFGNLVEKIKPWLFEFGNWIFGGLIAVNLIIVGSLLTVGPDHPAILVSIAAFACALPLNVSGLFLLKLIKDMSGVAIDDVIRQAFQDAEVPNVEIYFPVSEEKESLYKRRSNVGLRYSIALAALSTGLTMLGMVAALWYMAWWVGVIFLVMVIASVILIMTVVARWMPPESDAEKELKLRYREQLNQLRNAQRRTEQGR